MRYSSALSVSSSFQFRLPYNLYCVGGDVKHCTIQSSSFQLKHVPNQTAAIPPPSSYSVFFVTMAERSFCVFCLVFVHYCECSCRYKYVARLYRLLHDMSCRSLSPTYYFTYLLTAHRYEWFSLFVCMCVHTVCPNGLMIAVSIGSGAG